MRVMQLFLTLTFSIALVAPAPAKTWLEQIDRFDPTTGGLLGAERTWFDPDGKRLRWEITGATGAVDLIFFVRHDKEGREAEGIYFEGDMKEPDRETFTYSEDGRMQTTTYFYEPDVPSERTESDLNEQGQVVSKRYFRADGSQYGEEDVFWDAKGNQEGWEFRYVGREGKTRFRYDYETFDNSGAWTRRVKYRNEVPEQIETRTLFKGEGARAFLAPSRFAPGIISGERSETSPSFSSDGKTMVFARYGDAWSAKEPYIARLGEDGWQVEALPLGSIYNLAISPDGTSVFYAKRTDKEVSMFRVNKTASGWSAPENLTKAFGIRGSYPCLTPSGALVFYDAEGARGEGIYLAASEGAGFKKPVPVFTPTAGGAFDPYIGRDSNKILVTQCFDESCLSGSENGIWEVDITNPNTPTMKKLDSLPYGWGAQPVSSLGLLVFTDGEDILAVPLASATVDQ